MGLLANATSPGCQIKVKTSGGQKEKVAYAETVVEKLKQPRKEGR
jgi:hypothetical protein